MKIISPKLHSASRAGFSLIEVLLAMFILGIGLIMVATIFPVGAEWTRQTAEDNISQTIAQNALAVIQAHYETGGDHAGQLAALASTATTLQPLPSFTTIPLAERAYQYGNNNPFPASNTSACTYFWTALCRVSPDPNGVSAAARKYDIYILVFHKGDPGQTFTGLTGEPSLRNLPTENGVPTVVSATYGAGTYDVTKTPSIINAIPAIGAIGIGLNSGTVFRQGISPTGTGATPRPALSTNDANILYAPPADNTNSGSPLIYVYQTTLSY